MAVSVLETVAGTAATATTWAITSPSAMAVATTTIFGFGSSPSDASAPTAIPTGWAQNVWGQGSGLGVTFGTYERATPSFSSNLLVAADAPSTALTFRSTNTTSTGRNGAAVTFSGGHIRASARIWNGSIASGASGTIGSGNTWAMPNGGSTACVAGDKLIALIACNRFDADFTVTAGSMTLTNITKERVCPGNASGTPTVTIISADIGGTQSIGSTPTLTVTNPAGAAGSYMAFVYAIAPSIETADLGTGGNPVRVSVIGDSLTQGGAFAGQLAQTGQRYIDRLFGDQTTQVGALNFQTDETVLPSGTAAALPWYNGSYTPYGGTPTTTMRVRNMGRLGWTAATHILRWRTRDVANPTDSGKSPDILIINLGANDEKGSNNAGYTRDAIAAIATVHTPAPYVVLVKQWGWAFDYVSGSSFTRAFTHAAMHQAIEDAATLIRATGRTCIVTDLGVDAVTSGGTNLATLTGPYSFTGTVASSGASADNVHGNSSAHNDVWAPALRTALDQIPLLQPAAVNATVTPSPVGVVAAIPSRATAGGATVTSSPVAAVAQVRALSVSAGGNAVVTPAAVAVAATIPSRTVTAAANTAVTPAAVAVAALVRTIGVSTGGSVTASPAAVSVVTAVPSPVVVVSKNASIAAAPVTVTVAVPEALPAAGGSVTITPAAVTAIVTIPGRAISTGAGVIVAPVAATATIPARSMVTGIVLTPAPVNVLTLARTARAGDGSFTAAAKKIAMSSSTSIRVR